MANNELLTGVYSVGKPKTSGVARSDKDSIAFNAFYASSPAVANYFQKAASNPYERDKTMAMLDSQIELWTQMGNREKRDIYLAAKSQLAQLSTEMKKEAAKPATNPLFGSPKLSLGQDNIFSLA